MAKKKQASDDSLGLSGIQAARMVMEEREAYKREREIAAAQRNKEKADAEERHKEHTMTMESFNTMDEAIKKLKEKQDQCIPRPST